MNEPVVLGIDTSNYTCSAALFYCDSRKAVQSKRLLCVPPGARGVRQSSAVFEHTRLLPEMIAGLGDDVSRCAALGASSRPTAREGSYMPCFLVGAGTARSIALASGKQVFLSDHQHGHVLAALYSADKLELARNGSPFIALHVSGGTTDLLLCKADGESDDLLKINRIGGSSDLNAGQAVDRCGVMLGLDFPCGRELEKLAQGYMDEKMDIRPSVKGSLCSLSGIENQCRRLFDSGAQKGYIAAFCIRSVQAAIVRLIEQAVREYGELPVICAGGVMSNSFISDSIKKRFGAFFADAELSRDNAVGMAVFAALKKGLI